MSKEAVQALLSVPNLSTKAGRRDLALMITLYGTAMRVDELLSLTIERTTALGRGKTACHYRGQGKQSQNPVSFAEGRGSFKEIPQRIPWRYSLEEFGHLRTLANKEFKFFYVAYIV